MEGTHDHGIKPCRRKGAICPCELFGEGELSVEVRTSAVVKSLIGCC